MLVSMSARGLQRLVAALGTAFLMVTLQGCGSIPLYQVMQDGAVVPEPGSVLIRKAEREDEQLFVDKFAMMALFAQLAYRVDLTPSQKDSDEACAYAKDGDVPSPRVGLPSDDGEWMRWKNAGDAVACFNGHGLFYEVYVHRDGNGTFDEAVIAYRGTDNDLLHEALKDWNANLSWLLRKESREYELARERVPGIVSGLQRLNPQIRIYTTGHSLGGGLAQQAAYLSEGIKAAYAFDPSPITNWYWLKQEKLVRQADPTVYRIYHWNELLAYARAATAVINPPRINVTDYELYFVKERRASAHNMELIACNLAARILERGGDHHLSQAFARQALPACAGGRPGNPFCSDSRLIAMPNKSECEIKDPDEDE